MRIPGLGGEVMSKLGASTVSLPGGQIYENLVSGSIDATEWVGPYNDYFMKFYEAAKYYYKKTGRAITFEYILISQINDSQKDAKELANLLKGFPFVFCG